MVCKFDKNKFKIKEILESGGEIVFGDDKK